MNPFFSEGRFGNVGFLFFSNGEKTTKDGVFFFFFLPPRAPFPALATPRKSTVSSSLLLAQESEVRTAFLSLHPRQAFFGYPARPRIGEPAASPSQVHTRFFWRPAFAWAIFASTRFFSSFPLKTQTIGTVEKSAAIARGRGRSAYILLGAIEQWKIGLFFPLFSLDLGGR